MVPIFEHQHRRLVRSGQAEQQAKIAAVVGETDQRKSLFGRFRIGPKLEAVLAIGTVKPQETITTDRKIDNALFEEQEKSINRSKTK